jgi:hypothetical protein
MPGVAVGTGTTVDPKVYWGPAITPRKNPFADRSTSVFDHPPEGDITMTASSTKAMFYQWTDAERNKWGDHLVAVGLIAPEDSRNWDVLRKMWEGVVDETANATTAGQKIDPWAMTDKIAGVGNGGGKQQEAAKFTGAKTQTSTSTVLTDPATAKALIDNTLRDALGRRATDAELASFTATLNNAEKSHPTSTTTTANIVNDETKSQTSSTTGGLDSAGKSQVLLDEAMKKPDYGAYQASAYYMNALTSAIQSPVHVS